MMAENVDQPPQIMISNHELKVIVEFVYQRSTISDYLSLDSELNKRIGKGIHQIVQSDQASVVQQQTDGAHQDPGLQCLCLEYTPVWQQVLGTACSAAAEAHCLPQALPPMHPGYHLAGQGDKHSTPQDSGNPQHVHPVEASTLLLAWSPGADGTADPK